MDIRSLARCERVCKRWQKSSTLNYGVYVPQLSSSTVLISTLVWFLQNRALILPRLSAPSANAAGKNRLVDSDTSAFFDPFDKTPRLASLPQPPLPQSGIPQWSKAESKRAWKGTFRNTLKRSDPSAEPENDHLRVDISSLQSSGTSTPGRHAHAGMGAGSVERWAADGEGGLYSSSTERKVAARQEYKALGGRKSKAKRKMGGEYGSKDKGGAIDDGRFDAPW